MLQNSWVRSVYHLYSIVLCSVLRMFLTVGYQTELWMIAIFNMCMYVPVDWA